MKNTGILFLLLATATGCSKYASDIGRGYLHINLNVNPFVTITTTKGSDPATFTLDIYRDAALVKTISPAGASVEPVELAAGGYTAKAYSETFTAPAFDTPVYGGESAATVTAGERTSVSIACSQTNAGVRISYTDAFRANHSTYSASVRQIQGELAFTGSDAERTGYFLADEATVTVTADEVGFEYPLTLEPRKIYHVTVDDAPKPTTGELSVRITVSTDVTEEQVSVVFPSGQVGYYEDIGAAAVGSNTLVSAFKGWSDKTVSYSGSGFSVSASSPSDTYAGASGGNCLTATGAGASFTVSGLNTAMAATPLTLSFGSCITTKNYDTGDLTVSASIDNGLTFSPLPMPDNAHPANRKWALVTIGEGIPKARALTLRFECKASGYMIDDISLKTSR